jgi:hypothetical protein
MLLRGVNERFPAFTFFVHSEQNSSETTDGCKQRVAQKIRNSRGARISTVHTIPYSSPSNWCKCISVHTSNISLWFWWTSVEEYLVHTMMLSFKEFCREGHRKTVTRYYNYNNHHPSQFGHRIVSSKSSTSTWSILQHYFWHHVVHSCYTS